MISIEKIQLSKLLPDTPFDVGMPDRIVMYSKQDVLKTINLVNGKIRIYASLYSLNHPKIDRVWFDFDSINAYDNAVKFHKWCNEHNYKHMIVMSGGGFHCTVFTKNYANVSDAKMTLYNLHKAIANEVGLTIGDEKVCDIDYHIVGDIRRIYSIVGTYNCKRRKWVTSLTPDEVMSGLDNIKKLADKQRTYAYIIGDDYYDVDNFKNCKVEYHNVHIPEMVSSVELPTEDKEILELYPPCIQKVLLDTNGAGGFRGRYLFTVWSKELGYSLQQTEDVAKRFFSRAKRTDGLKNNWEQYKKVKTSKLVYQRDEMLPSCQKVFLDYGSMCPGRCDWYMEKVNKK